MRGTRLLFAAYHDAMEILLLFVLFSASSDPNLSEKLRSFLAFYRENRDFIALLAKSDAPMSETEGEKCAEKEERRPVKEVGAEKILEEYLNRLG